MVHAGLPFRNDGQRRLQKRIKHHEKTAAQKLGCSLRCVYRAFTDCHRAGKTWQSVGVF